MGTAVVMDKISHQRHLVEQDREDLGRTLHTLAGKVDVQARGQKDRVVIGPMRMRGVRGFALADALLAITSTAAAVVAFISVAVWCRR